VTDKLVTTLKELPGPKRSGVLDNIKYRLEINDMQPTIRTLTSHTHEWLLPQGDLQRVPIIAHPEQQVEQRVTPIHHANAPPLQCITEAPPIITVPNPTARLTLKLTQQMHSLQTRNNILGSVPEITCSPSAQWPLPEPIPAATQMSQTPRRSPQTHEQLIQRCLCASPESIFDPSQEEYAIPMLSVKRQLIFLPNACGPNLPTSSHRRS
jgi:hypothetical protein